MTEHFGIQVGRRVIGGETFWAEVVPSGGRWYRQFLPNVRRWWFEIYSDSATYAYEEGGSDGAYTLRACIRKADLAVDEVGRAAKK